MILVALHILFSHKPSQTPMILIASIFVPFSLELGVLDICENKVLAIFVSLRIFHPFSAQPKFGYL
jgi:hypothetical protein